jgi:hypothetical protein
VATSELEVLFAFKWGRDFRGFGWPHPSMDVSRWSQKPTHRVTISKLRFFVVAMVLLSFCRFVY